MHRGRARLASGDHCRTPDDQPENQGTIKVETNDHNSIRASGGTYPAYLHEHRKQVLMLRCLATKKGRATTTDPVMNFLVQLGDNGVIWKVLSFWPPPP